MDLSDEGAALLIEREGLRARAYQDIGGVWTIGIGHTAAAGPPIPKAGMVLTVDVIYKLFLKDIEEYVAAANKAITVPVTQCQFDACVSFCYNIGIAGFTGSSVVRCINQRDFSGAAQAFLNWNKPAAIIGRRNGEREQFLASGYVDTAAA